MLEQSKSYAIANVSAMIVVRRPGASTAMHYVLNMLSVRSSGEAAQNQNGRIRHAWRLHLGTDHTPFRAAARPRALSRNQAHMRLQEVP